MGTDGHLLPMKQLPESVAKALAGFEVDDKGALKKIKFEKLRALETLAKHHGVVAPDNSPQNIVINMSDEQIRRMEDILAYMRAEGLPLSPPDSPIVSDGQQTIASEVLPDKPACAAETRAEREERIAAMIEQQQLQETQEQRESRLVQSRVSTHQGFIVRCVWWITRSAGSKYRQQRRSRSVRSSKQTAL